MPAHYPAPKELADHLKVYDPAIRRLVLEARQIILRTLEPCHEVIWNVRYTIAFSYGPNGRLRDQICHLTVYRDHINIGFNFGAFMPDPENILLGKGSQVRHISFQSLDELARPSTTAYLRQALEMADAEDAQDRVTKGVVSEFHQPKPKAAKAKRAKA